MIQNGGTVFIFDIIVRFCCFFNVFFQFCDTLDGSLMELHGIINGQSFFFFLWGLGPLWWQGPLWWRGAARTLWE
jgi:hypothetical protein